MSKMIESNRTYFPALTGLRAIAAYLIFVHHYAAHHPSLPRWVNFFVTKFPAGLFLFFVLTGFLITYRYLGTGPLSGAFLKRYFLNRVLRIFPIYLVFTFITLLLAHETDWAVWATNLTLTKAFFNSYKLTGIPQAWSLTVDETFYLLAPILQLLHRRGLQLWLLLFGCYVTGFGLVWLSDALQWGSFFQHTKFMLRYTFFGHAFAFVLGMWLAKMYRNSAPEKQHHTGGLLTYMGFVGLFASMYLWSWSAATVAPWLKSNELGGILFNNLVMVGWCGMCVIGLVKENTLVSRLLSTKLFQGLGYSSYAFYLLHLGFFATFIGTVISRNPAVIFVATCVVAYVVHRYFEQPIVDRFGGTRVLRPNPLSITEAQSVARQQQ